MAMLAGQDGARRLRNGMMPLKPDWNTAWHMHDVCAEAHFPHNLRKPYGHDIRYIQSSKALHSWFVVGLKSSLPYQGNISLSLMVSSSGDWQFQWAQSGVAPQHRCGFRNRWNCSFPAVWSSFPGPLWGMCVSASGIWVRWSAIFIQIIARKTSIHLEIKRVFSSFEVKQKLCISLIKSSPTLSVSQCLVRQLICCNKCWYKNIVIRQQYSLWYLLSLQILMPQELFCGTVSFQSWVLLKKNFHDLFK